MVLRSCSAVLVDYLQAQVESFESCCNSRYVRCDRQLLRQLEVIRYNLGVIRDLKNSFNAIWHVPLAAMSAGLILLVCVVWYAIFYEGLFAPQVPLSASYCLYSSFAFIDMACVSQALTDQLRYLHETIDPDGMCLSGGGFFRLNKSLLVSEDPYAVNKACWTSDVKLLPPKSMAHVVVYLVFSPSQFTADTVQAYKSLEAYDYFE
ncbi:hypothetical protein HPB47_023616 [Ixodes persulcatus]|uniref:Uncharacterized protein n=1 Tax=Ixodes persulcatus TaxID=34615 RepID=A0AC60Q6I1_IXOPE|nr:hypothetical protein HPB47_023616 [Ixodes persulcatus]